MSLAPAHQHGQPGRHQFGLSYVEVLIASALIAVSLVPMLESLRVPMTGALVQATETTAHFRVSTRLTELLSQPFSALDAEAVAVGNPSTATSFSDAPGTPHRRLVFLSRYDGDDADADGDPFTGLDEGLLWLRVTIENTAHALQTLRAQ